MVVIFIALFVEFHSGDSAKMDFACNSYSDLLNALQDKGLSLNQQSLHMQVGRVSSKFQPSEFSSLIAWHAIPIVQLSLSTRPSFQNSDTKPLDQKKYTIDAMSMDEADVG
ncbi:Hypothetical predicted protein [Olea europaea subsp. europaea]|uniref:Uncharacterized protein n=1 Tax=Olea europaea subsp. europaea TaxID=158383 RepID=A0A8S0T3C8_OLEEU|nr:Hypothetical predicted protein [Olea europaea subsp. europaea]